MFNSRGPEPPLLIPHVAGSAECVATKHPGCKRGGGMGGFQPQASAIWELQEMGLELWKLSGVFFCFLFFLLAFYVRMQTHLYNPVILYNSVLCFILLRLHLGFCRTVRFWQTTGTSSSLLLQFLFVVNHFPYIPQESRTQCEKNLKIWV